LSAAGVVTFTGVAHPWMCDAMGHVNVRHYAAMFDDASFQLLGRIAGLNAADDKGLGWADVRCEIDYKHETPAGALLTIRSHVEKLGKSSLTYVHVMSGSLDGVVHAQARTVTVRFDLVARRKLDLDAVSRANAEALMIAGEPA
jgi:acyl-CoA thioester hydrolase